ncbi:unnamed protein product [Ectocarpus sp. 4 AP-2014]
MSSTGSRRCRRDVCCASSPEEMSVAAPSPPSSRRFPALVALLLAYLGTAEAFVASSSLRGIEAHRSAGLQSVRTAGRAGLVAMMSERRGLWPGRPTIDLRSDTVTQPTGGMRKAMHKAEVGDDVLGEDPTVQRLEAETAELLGKEAALFVPSGTMANLICHLIWCSNRGSEMIVGDQSHSFLWEQANAAQFGGIGYRPLTNLPDGTMDLRAVEAAVRGNNPCFPVSRLVTVENTHAQRGGKVLPIEFLDDLAVLAQDEGLRVHMDGARLWNAAAASGLPLSRITAGVDSVSVCFSKGLGAPVGSAVAGSEDFINRALRVRKALGGGMRQSGVVAAAALEGLRKHLPRIGDDHANARRLAQGFYDLGMPSAIDVDPSSVQTNIVLVTVGPDLSDEGVTAAVVCERLKDKGILAMAIMKGVIRFVTHSQVSGPDIQRTVSMMKEVLEEAGLNPLGVSRTPSYNAEDELEWHSPDNVEAAAAAAAAAAADPAASPDQLGETANGMVDGGEVVVVSEISNAVSGDAGPDSRGFPDSSFADAKTVVSPEMGSGGATTAELSTSPAAGAEGATGVAGEAGLEASGGADGVGEEGAGEEEKDELPPFVEKFEEVELQGMAVSTEGFVAIMTSKESTRALRLVVTPDDPMSGGLDVEQAETSEARTLLQLMQGIDVARHLPHDALGNLMDLSMRTGVHLSTVYVSHISPFSATLMAKVPQRDSETAAAATESAAAAQQLPSLPEDAVAGGTDAEEAWYDAGAAATAAAAAPPAPPASADDGGDVPETPVSPSVPGTTMGSGFGRPRLGLSKIAETGNSFEALGLALRYPSSRIFVRAELLAPTAEGGKAIGRKDSSSASSFESGDLAELYPNLMKLTDAKERRSASERMDSQFEMQKIRQQLESAMNAGDDDRISALREELNSLVMAEGDTTATPVS